jgi:mannose-6-phosphate isomerase-like protein (cupin superfamily)
MKLLPVLALLLTAVGFAGDPDGFAIYKGSELETRSKAAKMDQYNARPDRIAGWGNHSFMTVRREGDGAVETHATQADIIVVMSGEGTLIVGGTVVDDKATAPHEMRGKSITGGMSRPMAAGDVIHIPAGLPHQMLVPKSLVIDVVKVDTK